MISVYINRLKLERVSTGAINVLSKPSTKRQLDKEPTAAYLSEVGLKVDEVKRVGRWKLDIRMMIFVLLLGLVMGFVFQMTGRLVVSVALLVDKLQGSGSLQGYSLLDR